MSNFSSLLAAALLVAGVSIAAGAQAADSAAKTQTASANARDSVYLHARQLVLEGNGSAGRALVDSMLGATAGSPDFATGLYWRAALASTAADAERDYRRVIVDYPFSPHSGDALLALAQLEMARGDRESAIDHLQRFLLQQPNDPQRIRAGISLGRMLLDQNQLARGCAVLVRTRASLGDTAVEVRNQVDYYAARCAGVDTAPPPTAPAKPTPAPAKPTPAPDTTAKRRDSTHPAPGRDSAARSSTKPPSTTAPNDAKSATKRYTVQVAAYDTKEAANQLSTRLAARGVVARVVDIGHAPYRVRVGRYATDADATAAARDLKKKGIEGFVTTTDNETAPGSTKR